MNNQKKKAAKIEPEGSRKKTSKKSDIYIMRKNTGLKMARFFLWGILIFFFMMGILSVMKPDDSQAVTQVIQNFKSEFAYYKGENEEIMGFVQNFAKEYLTYQRKGESDYKDRIKPYVSSKVYNTTDLTDFSSDARAVYVQAYRKEQYSANQYDVYVLAEVQYEIATEAALAVSANIVPENKQEDKIKTVTEQTILKVPVYIENGKYIVEDIPLFTEDSILLSQYVINDYSGTPVSDTALSNIKSSLTNFFKAYYEDNQSVIEYYLSKTADKSRFTGLYGRYSLQSIESLAAYQEKGQEDTTCIIKIKIKDNANEAVIYQEFNIKVLSEGDKYYIKSMDTRIGNIALSY